ncbi:hypothetical protein ACFPRL_09500 [Pseudoclavibacter helvolus]
MWPPRSASTCTGISSAAQKCERGSIGERGSMNTEVTFAPASSASTSLTSNTTEETRSPPASRNSAIAAATAATNPSGDLVPAVSRRPSPSIPTAEISSSDTRTPIRMVPPRFCSLHRAPDAATCARLPS